MRGFHRLNQAYEEATVIDFDKDSKFVFFSDQHRGDDSLSDEFGRNKHIFNYALKHYYDNNFTYVEVGDGDEMWEQRKFSVIRNAHYPTFSNLRKFFLDNRLIMLFGNHNICYRKPARVKKDLYHVYDEYLGSCDDLFPGLVFHEALILKEKKTKQELFVIHGHQGDIFNDQLYFFSFALIRFLWRFMHIIGLKNPASPAKSRVRRHKMEKMYARWIRDNKTILICGHTHRPKFPLEGEYAYFNSGSCVNPRGIFCLELVNNHISLITWRVSTRRDGTMIIKKTILSGPMNISKYKDKSKYEDFDYSLPDEEGCDSPELTIP